METFSVSLAELSRQAIAGPRSVRLKVAGWTVGVEPRKRLQSDYLKLATLVSQALLLSAGLRERIGGNVDHLDNRFQAKLSTLYNTIDLISSEFSQLNKKSAWNQYLKPKIFSKRVSELSEQLEISLCIFQFLLECSSEKFIPSIFFYIEPLRRYHAIRQHQNPLTPSQYELLSLVMPEFDSRETTLEVQEEYQPFKVLNLFLVVVRASKAEQHLTGLMYREICTYRSILSKSFLGPLLFLFDSTDRYIASDLRMTLRPSLSLEDLFHLSGVLLDQSTSEFLRQRGNYSLVYSFVQDNHGHNLVTNCAKWLSYIVMPNAIHIGSTEFYPNIQVDLVILGILITRYVADILQWHYPLYGIADWAGIINSVAYSPNDLFSLSLNKESSTGPTLVQFSRTAAGQMADRVNIPIWNIPVAFLFEFEEDTTRLYRISSRDIIRRETSHIATIMIRSFLRDLWWLDTKSIDQDPLPPIFLHKISVDSKDHVSLCQLEFDPDSYGKSLVDRSLLVASLLHIETPFEVSVVEGTNTPDRTESNIAYSQDDGGSPVESFGSRPVSTTNPLSPSAYQIGTVVAEMKTYVLTADKALEHIQNKEQNIFEVMSQYGFTKEDYRISVGFNEDLVSKGMGRLQEIYLTLRATFHDSTLCEKIGKIFSPFPGMIITPLLTSPTPIFDDNGSLCYINDISRLHVDRSTLPADLGLPDQIWGSSACSFTTKEDITLRKQVDASDNTDPKNESKGQEASNSTSHSLKRRAKTSWRKRNARDDDDDDRKEDGPDRKDTRAANNASPPRLNNSSTMSFEVSTSIFTSEKKDVFYQRDAHGRQISEDGSPMEILVSPPSSSSGDLSSASPQTVITSGLASQNILFQKLQSNGEITITSDRMRDPAICHVSFNELNFQSTEAPGNGYLQYHARVDINSGTGTTVIKNEGPYQTQHAEELVKSTQSKKKTSTGTTALNAVLSLLHIATSSSIGVSVSGSHARETGSTLETTLRTLRIRPSQGEGIMSWNFHIADPHDQQDGLKFSDNGSRNILPKVLFKYFDFDRNNVEPFPIKIALSSYWKLAPYEAWLSRDIIPYENVCVTTIIHLPMEIPKPLHHVSTTDVQCVRGVLGSGVRIMRINTALGSSPVDGAVTTLTPQDHERQRNSIFAGTELVSMDFGQLMPTPMLMPSSGSSFSCATGSHSPLESQIMETSQSSVQSESDVEYKLVPQTSVDQCSQPDCVENAVFRCGGCRNVQYCSKDAHEQEWKYHSTVCKGKAVAPAPSG